MAADVAMRVRLMRSTLEQRRPQLTAEAAGRLQAQIEWQAASVNELAKRQGEAQAKHKDAELEARLDRLRNEDGRQHRDTVRGMVKVLSDQREQVEASAPWLRPDGTGHFDQRPPRAGDYDVESETRKSLLFAGPKLAAQLVLDAAARYHTDPESEALLAAVWTAPLATRAQLLPPKLKTQVLDALIASNGTQPLVAQAKAAEELGEYLADQFDVAVRELGLAPDRDRRAEVTTLASTP